MVSLVFFGLFFMLVTTLIMKWENGLKYQESLNKKYIGMYVSICLLLLYPPPPPQPHKASQTVLVGPHNKLKSPIKEDNIWATPRPPPRLTHTHK